MKDILYLDTVVVNGDREINVVIDRDYVMYLDYNQFYETFEHCIDDYEDNYGEIYEPDAVLIELTSIQFNNLAFNTCMNYTLLLIKKYLVQIIK